MPITSFTIAGVEVNPLLNSLEIRETTGNVSTLAAEVLSLGSPAVNVAVHDVIVVEEDGTTIFEGTVTQTRVRGFDGNPNLYDEGGVPELSITITAEDYARIAERVTVTATVADGTLLKTFLTTLVTDVLSALGVTLHASQVNGPPLPAMTFERVRASEVLQALSDATGYVSRIDYDKALRMWAPGDLAAPFNINEFDDPARWTGDVEVESIVGDDYANRVIVVGDVLTEYGHEETWTGDGTTTEFQLEWTPFATRGYVVTDYASDLFETLTTQDFAGTATWTLDTTSNTITRETGAPFNGADIRMNFDGTFQAYAMAEDAADIAAHGLFEVVIKTSDIRTTAAAQALADEILAQRLNAGEQKASYTTRYTAPTLRAGQQQTISASGSRGLTGDYILVEMMVRAETPVTAEYAAGGLGLIRTIVAKKSNPLTGKWQQTYHDWLTDTKGAGGVQTTSVATNNPGAPNKSVQFNRAGQFGGDAEFIYYEEQNSVVCGGNGSSITAADFESCQVFGSNCHITD